MLCESQLMVHHLLSVNYWQMKWVIASTTSILVLPVVQSYLTHQRTHTCTHAWAWTYTHTHTHTHTHTVRTLVINNLYIIVLQTRLCKPTAILHRTWYPHNNNTEYSKHLIQQLVMCCKTTFKPCKKTPNAGNCHQVHTYMYTYVHVHAHTHTLEGDVGKMTVTSEE